MMKVKSNVNFFLKKENIFSLEGVQCYIKVK
jgi:hypothetical protein